MGGRQADATRCTGHVVRLAVLFLAMGATVRAQTPELPSPAPPGDFASIAAATDPATEPLSPPPPYPGSAFGPGARAAPMAPRIEMGLFDAAIESLFGNVYAEGR